MFFLVWWRIHENRRAWAEGAPAEFSLLRLFGVDFLTQGFPIDREQFLASGVSDVGVQHFSLPLSFCLLLPLEQLYYSMVGVFCQ